MSSGTDAFDLLCILMTWLLHRLVRDQAFIAINLFIKRVEDMVASMVSSVSGSDLQNDLD